MVGSIGLVFLVKFESVCQLCAAALRFNRAVRDLGSYSLLLLHALLHALLHFTRSKLPPRAT